MPQPEKQQHQQLEHIEAIEKRLWSAADTLRANSSLASNEYFLPVMGLVFLRHAYSRFLAVKEEIVATLPRRGGKTRPLTKEDFSGKSAIFLRDEAQFDHLVSLPESTDLAEAISQAMESIENDYTNLRGALPKGEYQELSSEVLAHLLRTLNPEELKKVAGDVFGRIYEYFLTQFAGEKAHDGGEFFTPISLVSLIANVLEPESGTVLDPACGSGGMFVQSARVVEQRHQNPTEKLTFRGFEKNATTIRLAKMNLAVHGLEGGIEQAITYYRDPADLLHKADYVMANPPFNVDEIDADAVKSDPRLPFGLPGVNKKGKISNGNYVWISYFYSYLSEQGRAGFVMSSQASSAGRDEAAVRRNLIETGDVEAMIAIRSNFFYTRTVPCELWFFNRNKPQEQRESVLMIDARNVYRKVTRKIYDFSPEQQQNLLAIVWLYRGERERYLQLVARWCDSALQQGAACFAEPQPLANYAAALGEMRTACAPFCETASGAAEPLRRLEEALTAFDSETTTLRKLLQKEQARWELSEEERDNAVLCATVERLAVLADGSRELVKRCDGLYKLACTVIEVCEGECAAKESKLWEKREITRTRKAAENARSEAVAQLKQIRYFWRQGQWLTSRFPQAELCAVEGLVKVVSREELAANDWSLTPGRYVGVAPEEEDEDFDFAEAMTAIHGELAELNGEAARLAAVIAGNFAGLGI